MTNGTVSLGKSEQTEGQIIWSASADLNTNASTVTATVQVRRWDGNYTTTGTWTGSVSIGSSSASISHYAAVNGWVTVKTFTATVNHNSDGTGTCKISATVKGPSGTTQGGAQVSGSATVTLDTIPRASVPTVSASSVAMASKVTITTNRKSSSFTHDLTYSFGGSTGTIATGVGASYEWTVPISLAAKIPNDTKGTVTVSCKTWNGTSAVGTKTVSFTLTVPNNSTTQPAVTMSVSPVNDIPNVFSAVYVAGKSKVKVSYNASSSYSTIKSYSTEVLSTRGSDNPYTSTVLANSGTVTVTGKVTDARGYSTTKTTNIEVIPYNRPRVVPAEGLKSIVCERCNSDGKSDPGGVYLRVRVGRNYSKVVSGGSQKNYCKLSYRWKTDSEDESGYSTATELLSKTATSDYADVTLSGIVSSNTIAYNIQLIAEDDIGETDVVTITVPTAFVTFHVPAGGHGLTLGGYHNPDKYDVFDCRFDAEFHGTVCGSVLGLLGSSGNIPGDGNLNDYRVPGVYAVATDANATTIANMPPAVPRAGLLRVYASLGQDDVNEGNWKYVTQEYRSLIAGTPDYRRRLWTDGTGTWFYGAWVSSIDDVFHLAGKATQMNAHIYTDNNVETCQFAIRANSDIYVLNCTPNGLQYSKNGTVLWTK
jgi:hypothetical protein